MALEYLKRDQQGGGTDVSILIDFHLNSLT